MKRRSRAGGEPIKGRRDKSPEPKRRNAPKVQAGAKLSPATEETEVTRLTHELNEALEQQSVTSELLGIISSGAAELEPIFRAILEKATGLCDAEIGIIYRWDGDALYLVAAYNVPPAFEELRRRSPFRPKADTPIGRMIATKKVAHVADLRKQRGYIEKTDNDLVTALELSGLRTLLSVPMLKDGELLGVLAIYRLKVRSFTEGQIALVTNFAAQAVIAIENARLLNELRQSLEQQTATAEVLQVVSSSLGDLEPVFATMLEKAVRICDATFGNIYRWDGDALHLLAAHDTPPPFAEARQGSLRRPGPNTPQGRTLTTKTVVHVADLAAEPAYIEQRGAGYR